MARPSKYSAECRSDAIALWRASAGRRTFKDVAADLNVNPETLRTWVRDSDGRPASAAASQDTEAELARLRAENARLAKAEKEWQLEREILRRAAAYCAGARAERQAAEDTLVDEIREIHAEHRGNYGALRIHAELCGFGRHSGYLVRQVPSEPDVRFFLVRNQRILTWPGGGGSTSDDGGFSCLISGGLPLQLPGRSDPSCEPESSVRPGSSGLWGESGSGNRSTSRQETAQSRRASKRRSRGGDRKIKLSRVPTGQG
ncbi:transposase [Streptomyces sp. NPDC005149]